MREGVFNVASSTLLLLPPVPELSASVGNGHDQYGIACQSIHQTEWIAFQQVLAMAVVAQGPSIRSFYDLRDRWFNGLLKPLCCTFTSGKIPVERIVIIVAGSRQEIYLSHELPAVVGLALSPRPMATSRRCPHQTLRIGG